MLSWVGLSLLGAALNQPVSVWDFFPPLIVAGIQCWICRPQSGFGNNLPSSLEDARLATHLRITRAYLSQLHVWTMLSVRRKKYLIIWSTISRKVWRFRFFKYFWTYIFPSIFKHLNSGTMQFPFEWPVSFVLTMTAGRKWTVSLEKSMILDIHVIVYVCICSEPDPRLKAQWMSPNNPDITAFPRQHYCKAALPHPHGVCGHSYIL